MSFTVDHYQRHIEPILVWLAVCDRVQAVAQAERLEQLRTRSAELASRVQVMERHRAERLQREQWRKFKTFQKRSPSRKQNPA